MSLYKVKIGDKEYTVKIVGEKENIVEVEVNGTKFTVSLETLEKRTETQPTKTVPKEEQRKEEAKPATTTTPPVSPPGQQVPVPGALTSKVPGKIKEIKVTEGQAVKAGDTVIVIESMKMEIEVKANKDGVVKTIHVKPGQFVSPGTPLLLIE